MSDIRSRPGVWLCAHVWCCIYAIENMRDLKFKTADSEISLTQVQFSLYLDSASMFLVIVLNSLETEILPCHCFALILVCSDQNTMCNFIPGKRWESFSHSQLNIVFVLQAQCGWRTLLNVPSDSVFLGVLCVLLVKAFTHIPLSDMGGPFCLRRTKIRWFPLC